MLIIAKLVLVVIHIVRLAYFFLTAGFSFVEDFCGIFTVEIE